MHFHLQRDKRQESIAGTFSGYDLHRFGPAFKLFIQSFNDIACPQADPFIFGELKECQTGIYEVVLTTRPLQMTVPVFSQTLTIKAQLFMLERSIFYKDSCHTCFEVINSTPAFMPNSRLCPETSIQSP